MLVDVFYFLKLSMCVFIFSLLLTFILMLFKKPIVNGYAVGMLVLVSTIVSGLNMMIAVYIADEVHSGGGPSLFYMFFVILLLSIVNVILALRALVPKYRS